jgi:peptidoglycan hydrolase-like protein with peptidoglycan-binding domain
MKTRSAIKTWITLLALTAAGMMLATSASAQTSTGSSPATTGTDVKSPPDTKSGPPASPSNAPGGSGPTTGSVGSDTKSGTTGSDSAVKSDAMKSGLPARSAESPEQVKAVQQALKEKGHEAGDVDGKMGPKTEAALRDFQQKEGLKATGHADAETMAKLGVQAANTGAMDSSPSSSPAASPRGSSSSGSSSSSGAPSGAQSGVGSSPSDAGSSKDATSTGAKQAK